MKKSSNWLPFESAPKDGTPFLALIDGLPYKAEYHDGRFVWYMHGNVSEGPIYKRCFDHSYDKKALYEIVEAEEPNYKPQSYLWKRGMENKPTHWFKLEELPL
jgi:hypothetical protein